ncbi:MAG: hypothetical protein GEU81_18555 [Nitriliruptorales bacterium]|nr:hypothetical protein [Nitriliruptorales bacterium]
MARVIAGMTTSLDGFVADQRGSSDPLYPDLAALRGTPYMNAMISETGAVLMGRRTFEMADDPDWYVDDYEFQVPIFVVTPIGGCAVGNTTYGLLKSGIVIEPSSASGKPGLCAISQT